MAKLEHPLQIEINTTGAWRVLALFDGISPDKRCRVLHSAQNLAEMLDFAGCRPVKLRVTTGGKLMTTFDMERGWWPNAPHQLKP